ncbi:hypothetical protein CAL65_16365 [Alkalilimnicola ehrlichii]|uniref:AsmA domain-containing protein n=1 Tax=Alkalilimnicola ehrlichii TaxID=351052 RepID=A0A3E0WP47_9GAMM|nr:hypothetical protein CAL65_16365 [Alkalilimnicola ehrlichii]
MDRAGFLILVVLLLGAMGAALLLIDPNDYRDDIEAIVERETGRELSIEGDLKLSFYPWLGLELGRTSLADDPAFDSPEPFAEIERVYLAVRVLPLLRRQIELDTLVLEGARVRLIVDENGRGNWEQLIEATADDEREPVERPEDEEPTEVGITLADIGGVRLTDAFFSYEDRQTGDRYAIDPLNFETGRIRFNEPVPVQSSWTVNLPDDMSLAGNLRLEVEFDAAFEQLLARNLNLQLIARGEAIPNREQSVSLRAERINLDLAAGRYELPELRIGAAGIELLAALEARQDDEQLSAQARVDVPEFDARALLARLDIDAPETADPDVLQRVAATMDVIWADEQLDLRTLNIALDDTTISGRALVRSFEGPVAEFALSIDAIDLDRYLGPEREDEAERIDGEPVEEAEFDLPLELLRGLDLTGEFRLGQLRVAGLQMADMAADLRAENGEIRLSPMQANLYDGRFEGELIFDVREDTPRLAMRKALQGIQAGPLTEDLLDDDWVTGRGDVAFSLTMVGNSVGAWLNSLTGEGQFQFDEASVQGINIAYELRRAQARLQRRDAPEREDDVSDFARLTGSFVAEDGVIRNEDLRGESPLMRITGEGGVNLTDMTLDYLLTVNLVDTLTGAEGRELDELRRIPIPIRVRGPLDDFNISVDLQSALMQLHGEQLREAEREARERLQQEQDRLQQRVEEERRELEERLEREQERARERVGEEVEGRVRDLLRR